MGTSDEHPIARIAQRGLKLAASAIERWARPVLSQTCGGPRPPNAFLGPQPNAGRPAVKQQLHAHVVAGISGFQQLSAPR